MALPIQSYMNMSTSKCDGKRMIRFASFFVFLLLSYHLVVQVQGATVAVAILGYCGPRNSSLLGA